MDIDENDLLSTNTFIRNPNLQNDISNDANAEFMNFHRENLKTEESRIINDTLQNTIQTENDDDSFIGNTNRYNDSISINSKFDPKTDFKEVKTIINVDSRDRDVIQYPKPNHFDIFLGKTFNFVKQVKLVNIEFPNTNAVVNSTNNRLYWINKEDIEQDIIDSITGYYPIYSVELRIGSYLADTLGREMTAKINSLKRKNGTSDFHYFDITLDNETDVVSFISLTLTQLINNPIETLSGTGTIKVRAQNHGFSTGDFVYMIGCKTIAGIPASSLNGAFNIIVINNTFFQYEINVNAAETATGGGNTVKIGREAPFQFLFGDYPFTIAPNIGFRLENSSEKINTFIKSIKKFYQVQIILDSPHNFLNTSEFIGSVCTINISNTLPSIDGPRVITQVVNPTTFLISVNSPLEIPSFETGFITFNNTIYNAISISNFSIDSILVETFQSHNYTLNDINSFFNISETKSTPPLEGLYKITSIFSDTQFIIAGTIIGESIVTVPDTGGYLSRHNPVTAKTISINNITSSGVTSTLYCNENHFLKTGQDIMIYNLVTSPDITSDTIKVIGIINSTTFIISFYCDSIDSSSLVDAKFGTNVLTLNYPNHGFNQITAIYNSSVVNIVLIDTFLPHNLTNGSLVRISNVNSVPIIDGSYIITYVDSDTFSISLPHISTVGTFGVIGKSNYFSLYSVNSISGIDATILNNNQFSVLDIINSNTFTFSIGNAFTKTNKVGGGDNVYISSLKHGFSAIQTNTQNNVINRSINLQGENYSFLCSKQLSNIINTGIVKDIFARITLDQSPNNMVFNFLSNPKTFDITPLAKLDNLTLTVRNHDNTLYEFNDLDYSIALEVTELINTSNSFNVSSRYQSQNSHISE